MTTHPEKVLFPPDGRADAITKGEMAAYYEAVAPMMVPLIRGRPVTMERFPSGIGAKGFMQKNVSKGFPASLQRVAVPKKDGIVNYPLVETIEDLLWLVNQNCITMHVWTSRMHYLMFPDMCVFDLDPSNEDIEVLRTVALDVRDLLAKVGLASWVKTSGSKGFHVLAPLDGRAGFDQVVAFSHAVAGVLVQRDPQHLTLEFLKADRGGRIYMDIGRNTPGATVAAPYSVRPKPGAPVSAPCTWEEIEGGKVQPQTFTLRTMAERLATAGDLWADLSAAGQSLTSPIREIARLGGKLEVPVIRRFGR